MNLCIALFVFMTKIIELILLIYLGVKFSMQDRDKTSTLWYGIAELIILMAFIK